MREGEHTSLRFKGRGGKASQTPISSLIVLRSEGGGGYRPEIQGREREKAFYTQTSSLICLRFKGGRGEKSLLDPDFQLNRPQIRGRGRIQA